MLDRPKPQDVFTPRASSVNDKMYVSRELHESALENALDDSRNVIIHGESGCGKSWLYKRVLSNNKIPYLTVNMANANRLGGVNAAFQDRFNSIKKEVTKGIQQSQSGTLDLFMLKGGAEEIVEIEKLTKEPFELCLEVIRKTAKKRKALIVIENIESILADPNAVDHISNLITLIDDEDYSQYNVQLLIVGVPTDIQRYLAGSKNSQTVINRLIEIPEVDRLEPTGAARLLAKGMRELKIRVNVSGGIQRLAEYTDYIPQYLQEFGLELAKKVYPGRSLHDVHVDDALINWMRTSFTYSYGVVQRNMNSTATKVGRRNQALFCMGWLRSNEFKPSDVESEMRRRFEISTKGKP